MTIALYSAQWLAAPDGDRDGRGHSSLVQSGWLPAQGSASVDTYIDRILGAEPTPMAPSVQALGTYIEDDGLAGYLIGRVAADNPAGAGRIPDMDTLLHGLNTMLTQAPGFVGDDVIGLPFAVLAAGIDPGARGVTPFQLLILNLLMSSILQEWHAFLDTPASAGGFRIDGQEWLAPAAKARYGFGRWQTQSERPPYWHSWNGFFTRTFLDPAAMRPVADPDANDTVISPNDGSLVRWNMQVARTERIWFSDRRCALADLFTSPVPEQQATMDAFGLVDLFEGGAIFQSCVGLCDFQRWWAPVHGEVLFDPITIPGHFFHPPVMPMPDEGATLLAPAAPAGARGIVVFKTKEHGHVCCIPLGTSEVASVAFDPALRSGATVRKGQPMGMFNYGSASFAILYQKLPGRQLVFIDGAGAPYPPWPALRNGGADTRGGEIQAGARIGLWQAGA